MSKLSKGYLLLTFVISVISWGVCIVGNKNGILVSENLILNIFFLLGGWSPTIASYIILKKEKQVQGVKEWLGNVFDFKHSLIFYLLVFGLGAIYILPQYVVSGGSIAMSPVEMVILLPLMIFGGGLEEAGWRYILQPELEKQHSFAISAIIVSFFWWLWHLPLFFISEAGQYGSNYLIYGIGVIGTSFALAGLKRMTGSVWLCVLFHCLLNLLPMAFAVQESLIGNILSTVLLVGASYLIIKKHTRTKDVMEKASLLDKKKKG